MLWRTREVVPMCWVMLLGWILRTLMHIEAEYRQLHVLYAYGVAAPQQQGEKENVTVSFE